jgi:ferritin-like metal-binding protein YciE
MSIGSLQDLLVHELKDRNSAETQLVTALPRIAKDASSAELQAALTDHLEQAMEHVARLEQPMKSLGASPRGQKRKGMEGLLEEGASLMEEDIDPEVLDAGIIAAAQRVEHYEIAAYGSAAEFVLVRSIRTMW